ncbi:MAG: helix-turn-helix domain-containing protein [Verrucomicrobia bacterium]|nr:helix-turn-helix domain-containing protein [Verrucomicrobiota bacterium]
MPTHFAERVHETAESNQVAPAEQGGALLSSPTKTPSEPPTPIERLAYSIQEAADLLGVNYFSVYRLIQRGKLKPCRALRGKLLVPRSELLRLLKAD